MRYVHSLVKITKRNRTGWCAPAELGDATPQYVSFVLPVDTGGHLYSTYGCEVITNKGRKRRTLHQHTLETRGDSLVLRLAGRDVWFNIRPVSVKERRLPYIGKLKHPDFKFSFVEIEPDKQSDLDKLFNHTGMFIIGCDPFTHYVGVKPAAAERGSLTAS